MILRIILALTFVLTTTTNNRYVFYFHMKYSFFFCGYLDVEITWIIWLQMKIPPGKKFSLFLPGSCSNNRFMS